MTADEPVLIVDEPRGPVRAVALVLHGGRARSTAPVRANQLAVLRMLPFVRSLRRAGTGLVVARLRYRVRGWNGRLQSPVQDVRWALDRLAQRFPDVPVALVGHSMGGRAALHCADHPAVRVVVGLAPWIEDYDPVDRLTGRRLLIAHGDADRTTSPVASARFVDQVRPTAASAAWVEVRGDGHAMLRRAPLWHALAGGFVVATLTDKDPDVTSAGVPATVWSDVLAGGPSITV